MAGYESRIEQRDGEDVRVITRGSIDEVSASSRVAPPSTEARLRSGVTRTAFISDMSIINPPSQTASVSATAFGDRSMPYMLSLDAIWSDASEDAANISWVRDMWSNMQKHSTGRLYLNFPGLGEGDNLVRDAYGDETYARLQPAKRKYDPTNLFRLNQNIVPDK